MEQEKKTVFADGIMFTKKRDGAPDFVRGGVSVRVEQFYTWAKQHANQNGFVNLDLLKSKEKGTLYFKLNDWKKPIAKPDFSAGEVDINEVPPQVAKCKYCPDGTCESCDAQNIPF